MDETLRRWDRFLVRTGQIGPPVEGMMAITSGLLSSTSTSQGEQWGMPVA